MKFITASLTLKKNEEGELQVNCIDRQLDLTTESVKSDLADFEALIPVERTILKFVEHLYNNDDRDDHFAKALAYLHSDEYKTLAGKVLETPEYAALVDFLKNAILEETTAIDEEIQRVRSSRDGNSNEQTNFDKVGYLGFVKAIQAMLPVDEIKKLQDEKMKEGGDYATLIRRFHTEEFGVRYCNLITAPATLEWMEKSFENGVDVPSDVEYMFLLYGISLNLKP